MPLILKKTGTFEFEEKRSKFIGFCAPASSEDEAKDIINDIRGKHQKANHNVYAYQAGNIPRLSDDGEPHGTAGLPVFSLFEKTGVVDYVCVVTRYFGGILLGHGGLVRAYTKTAKGAMENAEPSEQVFSKLYQITCAYPKLDKTIHTLDKMGVEILGVEYTDVCVISVRVEERLLDAFMQGLEYGLVVKESTLDFREGG